MPEPDFEGHWGETWAQDLEERAAHLREDALELSKRDVVPIAVAHELRQAALRLDNAVHALRRRLARGKP